MKLKHYLLIFQLEGYKVPRFLRWVMRNFWKRNAEGKDPAWTEKAKLLYRLAQLTCVLLAGIGLFSLPLWLGAAVILLLLTNSYLLLVLAWLLLRPYEVLNRMRVKGIIASKVANLKSTRVVGITGSYGKTSTKMVLGQLLSSALITPKSYNTLFGIYKVVDYELEPRYRTFVCEMGAYQIGQIREFCSLMHPHIGMLTGINETHLERFGSLENTITGKFEILQHLRRDGLGIANLDNVHIRENIKRAKVPVIGYTVDGQTCPDCCRIAQVSAWEIKNGHMHFVLLYQGRTIRFVTSLLGHGHLQNLVGAIVCAWELGEVPEVLVDRVAGLKQIPRRLEYRQESGMHILDNTFSSNPDSFRESLRVLGSFPERKILVTPGIVELGGQEEKIHHALGGLAAQICTDVVLVGRSRQTSALYDAMVEAGFDKQRLTSVERSAEVQAILDQRGEPGDAVLFENVTDLPKQYS
jgi:UDP-N-acetylmuramoyl-tripeptide--D-alanyl-D-alanine ligase